MVNYHQIHELFFICIIKKALSSSFDNPNTKLVGILLRNDVNLFQTETVFIWLFTSLVETHSFLPIRR